MLLLFLVLLFLGLFHTIWVHRIQMSQPLLIAAWVIVIILLFAICMSMPNRVMFQKIAGLLAMPVGLFWSFLFLVGAMCWHRKQVRLAFSFWGLWLLYAIIGNGMFAGWMLTTLERDFRSIQPLQEKPFEAIFVLGGSTHTDHHGVPYITGAGDRVMLAARMFMQKKTSRLVASGSSIPGIANRANKAKETALIWRSLGVPKRAIVQIVGPYNTRLELLAFQNMTRERGWHRVGLVTSAWHLKRAIRTCRRIRFDVTPLPSDFRSGMSYNGLISLLPTGIGFAGVHTASWEWLGIWMKR